MYKSASVAGLHIKIAAAYGICQIFAIDFKNLFDYCVLNGNV